jgi:hypothetical protein
VTGRYTILARLLFRSRRVAQAGQSVILEQDAEFRLTLPVFRDERSWNTGSLVTSDGEAVILRQVLQISGQLGFQKRDLGQFPEFLSDLLDDGCYLFNGPNDFFLRYRGFAAGRGNSL